MAAKPGIPKGTRDFSPVEMAKRNYIFNTIRDVYHLYGFQQIETPSMENLSTLMGKYGDEGDKLLFKIQNSGDYFSGLTDEELLSRNAAKLASKFCEKGLRYDLIRNIYVLFWSFSVPVPCRISDKAHRSSRNMAWYFCIPGIPGMPENVREDHI